jgi:hypothetical protein
MTTSSAAELALAIIWICALLVLGTGNTSA